MGLIGLVAAVGGAMVAALAFWRLRGLSCPRCGGLGSFAMARIDHGDGPATAPTLVGAWHCRACGRSLPDHRRDRRMAGGQRLLSLARSLVGWILTAHQVPSHK
jgi:hypothetical protein